MKKLLIILSLVMVAGVCISAPRKARRRLQLAASGETADTHLTITFLTGVTPETVVLSSLYTGPATPALAEYDAGNGVWQTYASNTITMAGDYLKIRGDWRDSTGGYGCIFASSFASGAYTCQSSGTLDLVGSGGGAYERLMDGCSSITEMVDVPYIPIVGVSTYGMFWRAFRSMTGLEELPDGFLDCSAIKSIGARNTLRECCDGMSNVESLPDNFLSLAGVTGAPDQTIFYGACKNMSSVTNLPTGFMDTSNMSGAPGGYMFYQACFNMSGVEDGNFYIGSGITFTSNNVPLNLTGTFGGMTSWKGQCYWGTNLLTTVIPVPVSDIDTFAGDVNMPGYSGLDANWK